jgi:TonB family protein
MTLNMALLLASVLGGAAPFAATPIAQQLYRVELAGGGSVWAIGKPEVKGSQLLIHHYPDQALMSLRTTDVKRIVAASPDSENPKALKAAAGETGPLAFDTTRYDWGPYAAEMIRRIKTHWVVPDIARLNLQGKVTVRYFVRADGRVEGATILSRSGVPPYDEAALKAVLASSPLRPLPRDVGSDREGVTITFYYNIRPEGSGGAPNK